MAAFAGSPGIIFNDSTNALTTINFGNGTNAGSGIINFGFPGTNATSLVLQDYVDQTSGIIYRTGVSSTNWTSTIDDVLSIGWNNNSGGGAISSSFPLNGCQWEANYYVGANHSGPEFHCYVSPINGPGTGYRWLTAQWNAIPTSVNAQQSEFLTFKTDNGIGLQLLASDGNALAATATHSGTTATFTLGSGKYPVTYQVGCNINVASCSVSTYNTSLAQQWVIVTGGTGTTALTAVLNGTPSGSATGCQITAGSGYNYANITPSGISSTTGSVSAATSVTVNSGANTAAASSGLFLPVGSSAGGATGTNEVDVFNSGTSGNCATPANLQIFLPGNGQRSTWILLCGQ